MFTLEQSEDIHRSRVTLGEIKEAVEALKGKKSPGVDQLVAEAYQHLEAPELDGLAGRVTEVLCTGQPPVQWGGKPRPLYKKGHHLRPGDIPEWGSLLSIVDGALNPVPVSDPDQVVLKQLMAEKKGLTLHDLKKRSEYSSVTTTSGECLDEPETPAVF